MTKLPNGNYELTLGELNLVWGFMLDAIEKGDGEPPLPDEQDLYFQVKDAVLPERP